MTVIRWSEAAALGHDFSRERRVCDLKVRIISPPPPFLSDSEYVSYDKANMEMTPSLDPFDMYSLQYYIDSWIEVSSQPSSSSLSSAAAADEIVTTGLRVERRTSEYRPGERQRQSVTSAPVGHGLEQSMTSSSQEEYEESESESDRVLSASNEDVVARSRGDALLLQHGSTSEEISSSDDDDRSTALGTAAISSSPFVPQPNVFSHPPRHARGRSYTTTRSRPSPSMVSNSSQATTVRPSSGTTGRRRSHRVQHSPYNMISPSYQADHDAALRASLSTLLSCAAAARGLPKTESPPVPAGPSTAQQPTSFRLVPESVAMGEEMDEPDIRARRGNASPSSENRYSRHKRPARTGESRATSKSKRRASSSRDRESSQASASKKSRRAGMTDSVSADAPTLMTWVVSAGVIAVVTVISFSAGYVLGREVGRVEAGILGSGPGPLASAGASANCGREAVRDGFIKRLRWSSGGSGVSVS